MFSLLQSQVDVVSPIVVFKYDDTKEGPGLEKAPYAGESDEAENQSTLPKPLLNAFNTWVGKLYMSELHWSEINSEAYSITISNTSS